MFLAFGNNKQIATVANVPFAGDERGGSDAQNPSAQRVQRSNRYSPPPASASEAIH